MSNSSACKLIIVKFCVSAVELAYPQASMSLVSVHEFVSRPTRLIDYDLDAHRLVVTGLAVDRPRV